MNHGYKDRPIGPDREEGVIDACDNCERGRGYMTAKMKVAYREVKSIKTIFWCGEKVRLTV